MSISYSGLTNYRKASLPSVEMGLGSMHIIRDPPKSIMTRKIDKVGQTSDLTVMFDESHDRACESINFYARGVNPFVSVSYGNDGNNAGQRSGSLFGGLNGGVQAKLPYTIMKDGAFRPPLQTQEQLLPLSRQPRTNTESFSNPGFIDFSKKLLCPANNYRQINKKSIKASIRPTATYRIDTPLVEPYEVKYVIKNPRHVFNAFSNISGKTMLDGEFIMDTNPYIQDTLHSDVIANVRGKTMMHVDSSNLDISPYIQDVIHTSVQSKKSESKYVTPIEDVMSCNYTKDLVNISYTTPLSGNTKESHIHDDINLQRRTLLASAVTGKQQNIYVKPDIQYQQEQKRNRPNVEANSNHGITGRQSYNELSSREYKLIPKINAGSFIGREQMPLKERITNYKEHYDTNQSDINKKISTMQNARSQL